MSFEYRELTTQVFAGAGEQLPCAGCQTTGCGGGTKDDCGNKSDEPDCVPCQTTGCDTNSCRPRGRDREGPGEGEHRKALGLLREQLRDALAAG